ncbi:MAG: cytochrome c oxidase subunit II [Bacillaceae bacterium]
MKRARLLSLFALVTLLLGGCGKEFQSTLIPKGEVAKDQYDLLLLTTAIMVGVVIIVTLIFIYIIFKFKAKKGQEDVIPKQVEGNHTLEIIWTVIPIILLLILAVPTVSYTFKFADVKPMEKKQLAKDTVVVNVTSRLFWWEYEYVVGDKKIVTSQELVIPTDKRVYLNLKSSDIKHSFWVPSLAGKMDTNIETDNKMWIKADSEGTYNGFCTEFCGPSHALMQFKVKAIPQSEYDSWIASMTDFKPQVASASAKEGEAIFQKNCISCHAIETNDKRPVTARTAPNLANFGDRDTVAGIADNTKENIVKWLTETKEMKPGNKMAGAYPKLNDKDAEALADYLLELKVK